MSARTSGNIKSVEAWNIRKPGSHTERVIITKAVVRNVNGQFHGATNFRVNTSNVLTRKVQA
jgi:hypothetical protein